MKHRVVITGLGIVAPNAHGVEAFERALRRANRVFDLSRSWKS